MLQRAVEARRLGQHRHGGRAAARVGRDASAANPRLACPAAAGRGRAQLEFRDDVEARGRQPQGRRRRRRARPPLQRREGLAPQRRGTRCALDRAISSRKPLMPATPCAGCGHARIAAGAPAMRRAAAVDAPRARSAMPPRWMPRGRRCASASPHCSASARDARRDRARRTPRSSAARLAAASPPARSRGRAARAGRIPADRFRARLTRPGVTSNARNGPIGVASSQPAAPCTTQARSIVHAGQACRPSIRRWRHRRRRSSESAARRDWSAAPAD